MEKWPIVRQLQAGDVKGLGASAFSERTENLHARTKTAHQVVRSICPYCAVGCGQLVYVKDHRILDIEGDPDSPISAGCLCPKGAATFQLVTGSHRVQHVLYRRPGGREWEQIPLDQAMEMVAQRVKKTRDETFTERLPNGKLVNATTGIFSLGGATLDIEWNHIHQKLALCSRLTRAPVTAPVGAGRTWEN